MKYQIQGDNLPVVICELDQNESMVTQDGGMSWMSPNMEMKTTTNGGFKKAFGRMFSGAKMFQNIYTARDSGGMIAFASDFPGSIRAFDIAPGNEMILQKRAYLASESGVNLDIYFQKKISGGFFSGEGFILQKVSGNGTVFAEFDGHVVEYGLGEGQQLVVDTGHLAAMSATCSIEIKGVPGLKNKIFGGEGLFNTVITGPGRVWLQTMPLKNMAEALMPFMPQTNVEIK